MNNHTFQLSRNNKEKISLDSYLLNSTIPKKKNKQYKNLINLWYSKKSYYFSKNKKKLKESNKHFSS